MVESDVKALTGVPLTSAIGLSAQPAMPLAVRAPKYAVNAKVMGGLTAVAEKSNS